MIAAAIQQHVRAACVWVFACLLLLAAARTPWAQADYKPTKADWNAMRKVIQAQLDAFRADAGERAFSYAAPGIREQFKTAENFMRMVKTSYPAVYRPASVAFIDTVVEDGVPLQMVQFSDGAGGRSAAAGWFRERRFRPDFGVVGVGLEKLPTRSLLSRRRLCAALGLPAYAGSFFSAPR